MQLQVLNMSRTPLIIEENVKNDCFLDNFDEVDTFMNNYLIMRQYFKVCIWLNAQCPNDSKNI